MKLNTTDPKSLGGRMFLLKDKSVDDDQYVVEEVSSSNWHAPILQGLGADEEDLIGGEVDMQDDVFIEDDPDMVPASSLLGILGRILHQRKCSRITSKKFGDYVQGCSLRRSSQSGSQSLFSPKETSIL
jgi:hypothetical protein